jgi:hypothetical protein
MVVLWYMYICTFPRFGILCQKNLATLIQNVNKKVEAKILKVFLRPDPEMIQWSSLQYNLAKLS